ncbi:hypothetical protein B7P33_08855 [Sediminicola luteus]|uniref:Uncharacterized protein n=1 Tax=Sediminicola luteus TaxID=319238 RepID=A0A2A4G7I2_9FLAO|nr:hypothetical protein B7P33_08855 [Sediminicola luteus]
MVVHLVLEATGIEQVLPIEVIPQAEVVLVEVMASVVDLRETIPLREVALPTEAHLVERVLAHKHEEVHLPAVIVAAGTLLRTPEAIPDHLALQEAAVVLEVTDLVAQAVVQAEAIDLRALREARAEVTAVPVAALGLQVPVVAAVEEVAEVEVAVAVSVKQNNRF